MYNWLYSSSYSYCRQQRNDIIKLLPTTTTITTSVQTMSLLAIDYQDVPPEGIN